MCDAQLQFADFTSRQNKRRSSTAIFSVNGAQRLSNKHQLTSEKKPLADKKVLMKTFSENLMPLALENYEFQDGRNMKVKRTFLHFRTIKIPITGTQSKIIP